MLSEEAKNILERANGSLLIDFQECKKPGEAITIEDIIKTTLKDDIDREYALADIELSAEIQKLNFRNRK